MTNRIKQWSFISVFAGLILLLTGCFAEKVDKVNIHFPIGGLTSNEKLYIRYEDGSTVQVNNVAPSVTGPTYTVRTDQTKKVIGYFVEGFNEDNINYNWVPFLDFENYPITYTDSDNLINLDINLSLDYLINKPTHEISYAKVALADESTGLIILYDKYDNPINLNFEFADIYVKTDNKTDVSFIDYYNQNNVTDIVYSISGTTLVPFQFKSNIHQEYTVSDLALTVYSGTKAIPVYAYDYIPQLDLNHDGFVDIGDAVRFAKNPFDAYNDGTIKDIPFVLSKIPPHSQTLRIVNLDDLLPSTPQAIPLVNTLVN
jgi:hypothetical protein